MAPAYGQNNHPKGDDCNGPNEHQDRREVAGSGDIEAIICSEVRARVAGSGDILVRGDPPHRDHSVAGSGKIKFR